MEMSFHGLNPSDVSSKHTGIHAIHGVTKERQTKTTGTRFVPSNVSLSLIFRISFRGTSCTLHRRTKVLNKARDAMGKRINQYLQNTFSSL